MDLEQECIQHDYNKLGYCIVCNYRKNCYKQCATADNIVTDSRDYVCDSSYCLAILCTACRIYCKSCNRYYCENCCYECPNLGIIPHRCNTCSKVKDDITHACNICKKAIGCGQCTYNVETVVRCYECNMRVCANGECGVWCSTCGANPTALCRKCNEKNGGMCKPCVKLYPLKRVSRCTNCHESFQRLQLVKCGHVYRDGCDQDVCRRCRKTCDFCHTDYCLECMPHNNNTCDQCFMIHDCTLTPEQKQIETAKKKSIYCDYSECIAKKECIHMALQITHRVPHMSSLSSSSSSSSSSSITT